MLIKTTITAQQVRGLTQEQVDAAVQYAKDQLAHEDTEFARRQYREIVAFAAFKAAVDAVDD